MNAHSDDEQEGGSSDVRFGTCAVIDAGGDMIPSKQLMAMSGKLMALLRHLMELPGYLMAFRHRCRAPDTIRATDGKLMELRHCGTDAGHLIPSEQLMAS